MIDDPLRNFLYRGGGEISLAFFAHLFANGAQEKSRHADNARGFLAILQQRFGCGDFGFAHNVDCGNSAFAFPLWPSAKTSKGLLILRSTGEITWL
jgi:hypothetical protein